MKRILVIAPHPDDETIGLGGTLRGHVVAGDRTHVVFLTSGEAGGHGIDDPAGQREAEAVKAAEILGLETIEFWRMPDGAVRASRPAVARLRELLESTRPDIVYVPHSNDGHSDHRASWRMLRGALRDTGVPEVREYELWSPLSHANVIVDITAHVEHKLSAIRAYESQCNVMRFDDAFLGLARYRGEMLNWPDRGYAEAFLRRESPGRR